MDAMKIVTKAIIGDVNDWNVVGMKFCINNPIMKDIPIMVTARGLIFSGRLISKIPTITAIIDANINADFI